MNFTWTNMFHVNFTFSTQLTCNFHMKFTCGDFACVEFKNKNDVIQIIIITKRLHIIMHFILLLIFRPKLYLNWKWVFSCRTILWNVCMHIYDCMIWYLLQLITIDKYIKVACMQNKMLTCSMNMLAYDLFTLRCKHFNNQHNLKTNFVFFLRFNPELFEIDFQSSCLPALSLALWTLYSWF